MKENISFETIARIDNAISEIMLYYRKSEKEVLELFQHAFAKRQQEWEIFSSESVLNFHRNTTASIYCYLKWNSEEKYQKMYQDIFLFCNKTQGRILDFGGGTGELTINLASQSFSIDYLDVPGKVSAFAKWRFNKRFLNVKSFSTLNDVPTTYQNIVAIDVLSYLEKPLVHLKKFQQLLNKGGLLFLSRERINPDHPMVLAKNANFLENIEKHCLETGFLRLDYPDNSDLLIFSKKDS